MKKTQIQQQKQLSAHDKVLLFDNLRYLLEGLEEFIEKSRYYPDFKNRRKLQNITIPKERSDNLTADSAEQFFKANLILYVSMVDEAPPSEREKLVEEYLKWVDIVGIDPNNCPEKLRQFLIEIKDVLEGNSERIIQQTQEYLDNKDGGKVHPTNPQDTLTLFSAIQAPLNKNREQAKSYEGKTYRDVEITNKFSGSVEQGGEVFNQIAGAASRSGDFHFYSRQLSTNNPQQRTNFEIIQDIRQNPGSWRLEEVITQYNAQGGAEGKEMALVHSSAQVGFDGAVLGDNQPVYLAQRFDQREIAEINQVLNISQQSSLAQVQQQTYKWRWE